VVYGIPQNCLEQATYWRRGWDSNPRWTNAHNGFRVLWSSYHLVHLVLSSVILSSVSCYPVHLVLSSVIWFCLQLVYKREILSKTLAMGRNNARGRRMITTSGGADGRVSACKSVSKRLEFQVGTDRTGLPCPRSRGCAIS
jgi:hypothetical protein